MTRDPKNPVTSAGIETPDLPAPLAALVAEVVRRTRLRRREQAEIAAELNAHFRDGLASGRTAEELRAAFGDPRASALEIRHGAIAKRGVLDRGLRRVLQVAVIGVAAILVAYLALAVRVALLKPTLSQDSLERYRALMPRTDDPAWPAYLAALAWVRSDAAVEADFGSTTRREIFLDAVDRYGAGEPGAEAVVSTDPFGGAIEPIDLRAILAAKAGELEMLRRAAAMPVLGREPTTSATQAIEAERSYFGTPDSTDPAGAAGSQFPQLADTLLAVLLPQLAELRQATRLLLGDARVAEDGGDFPRAAADFAAVFGMARHAEENRTLVGQLVASALRIQASRAITAMLERSGDRFDEGSLAAIAAAVASVPASSLRIDMTSERLMFEDLVQRLYSDDGAGDGLFIPWAFGDLAAVMQGSTDPASGPVLAPLALVAGPLAYLAPGRRETVEQYERWLAAVEEDASRAWWDDQRSADRVEEELFPRDRSLPPVGGNALLKLLLPAVGRAGEVLAAQRFDLDAAAMAVALARFRAASGQWPRSLEQLVPSFLPSVPLDPETTLPYCYELRESGPVVWSTGPDGIDDGGRPFRDSSTASPETNDHRDFVRVPAMTRQAGTLRKSVLRHRERTGRWPASIEELGEEAPPIDPYDRVEYLLVEGEPVIRRVLAEGADSRRRFLAIPSPGDRLLVEWGLGTFGPIPEIRRPDWAG